MIPKHFNIGRLHVLWWPLRTLRGRLEIRWDRSPDGKQMMRELVDDAIAARWWEISHRLTKKAGDYIYGGSRTMPSRLGQRWRQRVSVEWKSPTRGLQWAGYPGVLRAIREGFLDYSIEKTWHEAAAAEHYYRHEKEWGWDDDEAENQAILEDEIDF